MEGEKEEGKRTEDAACVTKKKYEYECLSCGQGTVPAGGIKETRESGFRVGPGFSKILNLLHSVVSTEDSGHFRTRSDLSGSLTERITEKKEGKKSNIRLPRVVKAG